VVTTEEFQNKFKKDEKSWNIITKDFLDKDFETLKKMLMVSYSQHPHCIKELKYLYQAHRLNSSGI